MDFDNKISDSTTKIEDIQVTAPTDGYYEISSQITKSVPTGRTLEMKNTYRVWWKPWTLFQSKTYVLPEYKNVTTYEGKEVKFFKAGEVICGPQNRIKT